MTNARMQAAILPGGRLHLHDGPIDLVIGAEGERDAVRQALPAATRRFATVLDELCAELPLLRDAMDPAAPLPASPIALRMDRAVRPLSGDRFITRMAAVAGSVADEILAAMCASASLTRAWVNNGGDIALHLAPGTTFDVGLISEALARGVILPREAGEVASECEPEGGVCISPLHDASHVAKYTQAAQARLRRPPPPQSLAMFRNSDIATCRGGRPSLLGTTRIAHADPIRGIATSGRGGRSFSLGIADAATILAADAASADALATFVANAIDLRDHPAITRVPASALDPQSDLGERLVTRDVGNLSRDEIEAALDAGVREAERLRPYGLVAAALSLRGCTKLVGTLPHQTGLRHAV